MLLRLQLLLILCAASAACTQGPWSSTTDSDTLPDGKLYTLRYTAPGDTGFFAIAVVELDSTVRCGGSENRNYFPPEVVFDYNVWCAGSPDTLAYQYDGDTKVVRYAGREYDVSESPLLVALVRPDGATLYHPPEDSFPLPSATERELREQFPEAFR